MSKRAHQTKGWDQAATYAQTFATLCDGTIDAILDSLGPAAGALLDVGAGPGHLAQQASARGWSVTVVEPETQMLRIAATQAPSATLVQASLPNLPFADGAADAVVANFVVNHLADPRAGVVELVRLLKPGGVAAVTVWAGEGHGMNQLWTDVSTLAQIERPTSLQLPAAADFPRTADGLGNLLADAGIDAQVRTLTWDFQIAPDLLWAAVEAGIASMGVTYLAQDHAGRARIQAAYQETVAARCVDGLVVVSTRALFAVGRV